MSKADEKAQNTAFQAGIWAYINGQRRPSYVWEMEGYDYAQKFQLRTGMVPCYEHLDAYVREYRAMQYRAWAEFLEGWHSHIDRPDGDYHRAAGWDAHVDYRYRGGDDLAMLDSRAAATAYVHRHLREWPGISLAKIGE